MEKQKLLELSDKLLHSVILISGITFILSYAYFKLPIVLIGSVLNIILVLAYIQLRKYADVIVMGSKVKSGLGQMASMLDSYG